MPNDEKNKNAPSIWAWKNTAHITKTTMEFGFAIAAVLIAGTAIYTAAKGVALSSALPAFLANPWVIAAIASYVAIYLVARSISSYQQLYSMEGAKGQDGKNGENGKDADFSALLGGAVKGAKIVEKEVTENNSKVKKLCLELGNNREALLGEKNDQSLFLIFKDKDGKYQFKALGYNVENNNVIVTSVDNKEVKA
ncbi:MAG: hypothetical protein KTV72_03335, partial [Wolbachia endosymbiont of Melophagus ovinus]|nr:hypothetical protein [Wolbachia endosymbiont of Melophagus ovinus]